jgi:hypothetical protein
VLDRISIWLRNASACPKSKPVKRIGYVLWDLPLRLRDSTQYRRKFLATAVGAALLLAVVRFAVRFKPHEKSTSTPVVVLALTSVVQATTSVPITTTAAASATRTISTNLLSPAASWISDDLVLAGHVRSVDCKAGGFLAQLSSDKYESVDRPRLHAAASALPNGLLIDTAHGCPGLRDPYDRLIFGLGPFATREKAIDACAATGRSIPDDCFPNSVADDFSLTKVGDACPSDATGSESVVPSPGSAVVLIGTTERSRVLVCRNEVGSDRRYYYVGFHRSLGLSIILDAPLTGNSVQASSPDGSSWQVSGTHLTVVGRGTVVEDADFDTVEGGL